MPRRQNGSLRRHVRLEDTASAEGLVGQPGRVPDVEDEPAVARGGAPRVRRAETRFVDHQPTLSGIRAAKAIEPDATIRASLPNFKSTSSALYSRPSASGDDCRQVNLGEGET